MSCKQEFLFFKEWASYIKKGELSCLEVVLRRSPSNAPELAFLFEITTQLCILAKYNASLTTALARPVPFPLANFAELQSIAYILRADYAASLIKTRASLNIMKGESAREAPITSILTAILTCLHGEEIADQKGSGFKYLVSLGKCYYLLSHTTNSKDGSILQELKERWSVRKLAGPQNHQHLLDLLIMWGAIQAEQQLKNDKIAQYRPKLEEYCEGLLYEWFEGMASQITSCALPSEFGESDLTQINQQSRIFAKTIRLKGHKDKRSFLLQLKKKILSRVSLLLLSQSSAIIFGCYFTIISSLCAETDEKIQSIITLQDLLANEVIFYSCFWQLSRLDILLYFTSFGSYMRENSQYSILEIYHKINYSLANPHQFVSFDHFTLLSMVHQQRKGLLKQVNVQPANLSKAILEYYLQSSGIPLSKAQRSYNCRKVRKQTISPIVHDPLHFMMVENRFWNDNAHRQFLEIALWISLHFYCRWLQSLSLREATEKQTQQYIKRLNLAVTIFCFSLEHPTRLLQYQPVESDCLKELFVQPIFPTAILNCKYFFQSYNWGQQKAISKTDGGLESWTLPWAHLLAGHKNMVNFIYMERGYELAYLLATQNPTGFEKNYGEFFVTRIHTELQGLGINLSSNQAQGKQKFAMLHSDRKKFMILLLKQCEKSAEKMGHSARRILQILADK